MIGAVVNCVQVCVLLGEELLESVMDGVKDLFSDDSASDGRLGADDDQLLAHSLELGECFWDAR